MAFDYDLFVIGGGSGGVRAARIAAGEYGAKVALAEEYRVGGTCVIRGCVPKKLMVFASNYPNEIEDARSYGWTKAKAGPFDWSAFRERLDAELDRLEGAYRSGLEKAGVTVLDQRAVLEDAHTVRLADGSTHSARYILIATGGRPFLPEAVREAGVITSNEVFKLDELPKSILIVGGGYIASEFACILNGLGVAVTQYYRGAQILRGFDEECRGHVADAMQEAGIAIHCGTDVLRLEPGDDGVQVTSTTGREEVFDKVLYATGRVPNTEGLGLADLGVKLGRRGEVIVDSFSQTSVPSIFAVGDVTDRINLTPVAIREGPACADTIVGGNPTEADHDCVASAVFTTPEFASVGMTEEVARDHEPIEVYCAAFRPMQSLFAGRQDRVMMKLIVARESRRVLGCHIVAPHAAEMIQLAAVAVKMGATKEDFDRAVAVHPTMAEELVTLRNPVRTA